MGLGGVELIMAIEDEFGIDIADGDAETLTTPGEVTDYVMARIRTDARCPSQTGFYRLRSILMKTFDMPRNAIRPDTPLSDFIQNDVRQDWQRIWAAIGKPDDYPKLRHRPFIVFATMFLLPIALAVFIIFNPLAVTTIGEQTLLHPFQLLLFLLGFLFFHLVARFALRKTARHLPLAYTSVKSLVPFMGSVKTACWTRQEVLEKVILLTSKQLGTPTEKIREDSKFIRDLGMD